MPPPLSRTASLCKWHMSLSKLWIQETDSAHSTSPSAYVGFPVISAVDRCGTIGSVHTSATLAYAPEDLSTGLLTQETTKLTTQFITHTSKEGSTMSTSIETFVITPRQNFTPMYEPFDFADAHCPPASLKSLNLWTVIGPDGHYNPIISPLKGLTNIDPAWNQNCFAAPFQGNDPPFALTPAKALTPVTTSAAPPEAITIPATPSNSPMILPPVTSMVSSSTPKVTNTLPNDPPASDPNRGSNEPASPAPIPVEPTNQSPNSPPKGSNLGANPESKGPAPLAPKSTVTLTSTFVSQGQVAIASTIATILGAVVTLPVGTTNAPGPSIPAIIVTYGGSTYTAIGGAGPDSKPTIGFVIGSQTLTPGGVITVSETPLILAAGPTSGNDGNSTIGGLIIAPFNGEARKLSLDVRLIPILVGIMWLLVL